MFFTAINQMMTEGVDLTIVIRKANGQMAVSTLPKSNGLKDEAQNHIVPLTVSGLPEELDAGFLQTVARPIQKVAGLITNMAQFEAQADKAAADSKAAKEEKAKETKEEKEKREKYEKHLKKAEELIAAGKHSEAVSALGQARLHAKPQDLKKIDSMVEEQKKAMNKGSLFELMDEPAPQPQPQPQQQPQPMAAKAQQPQARTSLRVSPWAANGTTATATTNGSSHAATALSAAAPGSETDSRTTAAAYDGTTAATAFDVATATTAAKTASATAAICRTTAYGSAASIRGTV